MVLKRCKAGFNTGNSFGRRRVNYLRRAAAASWAYVTTGARVSSLKHVQSIDALMLDLSSWHDLAISVTEAGHLKAAHSTQLDDGTTTLESVAYSLNKKKRWQSVDKFEQGINSDVAQLASERDAEKQCALSFMVCERAFLDSSNRCASTKAKVHCVACSNVNVQPHKEPKQLPCGKFSYYCRECPNCDTALEKIDGCNHVCCLQCNFVFCWNCMKQYHFNPCKPVVDKPILFTDVMLPRINHLFNEVAQRNARLGYPSYCPSDTESAEDSPSAQRRIRTKCHHNQHFRGVQRPEKVKREVQAYKRTKRALLEQDECDSQASKTDKDDVRQVTPHLFYAVDKAKALSSFVYSKLMRNQPKPKASKRKRQRKRNVEVDSEEAHTLAHHDLDCAHDWQYDVEDEHDECTEDECRHENEGESLNEFDIVLVDALDSQTQQQKSRQDENENNLITVTESDSDRFKSRQVTQQDGAAGKMVSLIDYVRTPRKNTHAGRARKAMHNKQANSLLHPLTDSQLSESEFTSVALSKVESELESSAVEDSFVFY